jgi:hypothetical protein
MPPKPPSKLLPWNNYDAVATWVGKAIDDAEADEEYDFATLRWDTHPPIQASEVFDSLERDAIDSAKSGNMRPLADLIDSSPKNPLIRWLRSENLRVGPTAEAIVAGRLRGDRSKRGRPKQSIDERQANTRVHSAAAELKVIRRILDREYSNERHRQERAITIAAKRQGIDRTTLENYLKKINRHLP